ncbi:PREDICTED: LOW QUALITY PROTEIN: (Z)-3-hexen-1-ol acetyltransferase-like [Tarenaya hassleriana]|uniref:LOW QUALITY PROTEIN: (Z)-3-hexen-1-ol acetyltransferase-like n=1 Tax=Tarenaya hassleriana TaxID=28532 RepID=UPI00053C338C|nr:PREDICTED: LOW QUALITY PROTEIN: (Z)-3-hexen-1-ol acetyltransferase-like [Tarenaya hassleriana]
MELRPATLVFKVHRKKPELISPAKPTPRELKILSDIDDQYGLRYHLRAIFVYRHNPIKGANNNNNENVPALVIRKALAETLVYYYPFAGRLREGPNRKLMVDCNGKGVLFVEADADVALDDFGQDLHPPFPEELLSDVEDSMGILNSPLILIQVTRLKCRGFIFALRFIHACMCDAAGLSLFLKTLGEIARGATEPSIPPVWDRHLLNARVPARVTHVHREYDKFQRSNGGNVVPCDRMIQRSFFFGPREISAIRRLVPPEIHGRTTTFELLMSLLWRCRTIALQPLPNTETRIVISVNARPLLQNPPLPPGYYGNAIAIPVAIATARELSERPLEFALRLVQEAKSGVTEDYVRSMVDLLGTRGRKHVMTSDTFLVSDVRRVGSEDIDLGWGPAVYGGPAEGRMGGFDGISWLVSCKNTNGETGTLVLIILPEPAMKRLAEQLTNIVDNDESDRPIKSSL